MQLRHLIFKTKVPMFSILSLGEIDIKSCFKQAWKTCWANFPGWIGVMLVGGIVATLSAITIVGYFLVIPVLGAGAAIYILNALKG
jgi:hypothetical protein